MKTLLLSSDLMLIAEITGIAQRQGFTLETAATIPAALPLLEDASIERVVVDLNLPGVHPAELTAAGAARHSEPLSWVAIGPHVHVHKLEAARAAGWTVFTRGHYRL